MAFRSTESEDEPLTSYKAARPPSPPRPPIPGPTGRESLMSNYSMVSRSGGSLRGSKRGGRTLFSVHFAFLVLPFRFNIPYIIYIYIYTHTYIYIQHIYIHLFLMCLEVQAAFT